MRNDRGFAMVLMISILPIFLGMGAALFVVMGIIEDRAVARNSCRRELLRGLDEVAIPLENLLALNPKAFELRMDATITTAHLAAAVVAGNPVLAARAIARLKKIRRLQIALDEKQQILLKAARRILQITQTKASSASFSSVFFFLKTREHRSRAAKLAVRPDLPGLAPIYVLEKDFEREQALVHRWQSEFQLRGALANFAKAKGQFSELCAATLERKKGRWESRLIEDKFLSKASY